MREYEIYVPITAEYDLSYLSDVNSELKRRFSGYSYVPQALEGPRRSGDDLAVIRVLTERDDSLRCYFSALKVRLESDLKTPVLIVCRDVTLV